MRRIAKFAFANSSLDQVRFLGTAGEEPHSGLKPHSGRSSDNTKGTHLESEHLLVIGEKAFFDCENLRQVVFEPGSAVEEIQQMAFRRSGLESFTAPPSLRKISIMAFRECDSLKRFEPNENIQELGWFCLWETGISDLYLPPHIRMTREQLDLAKDSKVLRLPKGLEAVGDCWFTDSDI